VKTSPNGRNLIESFEGLILQAYDDYNDHVLNVGDNVHGTLTIGYGHTNAAGPPSVHVGQKITKDEADNILAADLEKVEREVSQLVKVPLNQNQFDALVSFEFNTGALGKSSILTLLNNQDYSTAADHILLYDHAGGRVLAGLQRRRQAERKLFLTSTQTQGKTMNPFISAITTIFGPTQVGGWVRAAVASGLTYAGTKYGASFLTDPGVVSEIGAVASTVVVGLWSSLAKSGTVYMPDVLKTIQTQAATPQI
jgi:lysozyme